VEIYTIGFTKKPAASFFDALRTAGIRQLLDTRLNNSSQLAGFAKRDDLAYFLRQLCGARYEHRLDLAPTSDLLDAYRKHGMPSTRRSSRRQQSFCVARRRPPTVIDAWWLSIWRRNRGMSRPIIYSDGASCHPPDQDERQPHLRGGT
jgi:hypothetical protein